MIVCGLAGSFGSARSTGLLPFGTYRGSTGYLRAHQAVRRRRRQSRRTSGSELELRLGGALDAAHRPPVRHGQQAHGASEVDAVPVRGILPGALSSAAAQLGTLRVRAHGPARLPGPVEPVVGCRPAELRRVFQVAVFLDAHLRPPLPPAVEPDAPGHIAAEAHHHPADVTDLLKPVLAVDRVGQSARRDVEFVHGLPRSPLLTRIR